MGQLDESLVSSHETDRFLGEIHFGRWVKVIFTAEGERLWTKLHDGIPPERDERGECYAIMPLRDAIEKFYEYNIPRDDGLLSTSGFSGHCV